MKRNTSDRETGHVSTYGTATALDAGKNVLQYFWDLADLDETIRNKAAVTLVEEVVAGQEAFEAGQQADGRRLPRDAEENEGKDTETKDVQFALRNCSPLTSYTLKRLARGLGSSNKGARQGFGVALAALLERLNCISAEGVLALMDTHLHTTSAMKGGEVRDLLLGEVFGLGCLVSSGSLSDVDLVVNVVDRLLGLMKKKLFLREVAVSMVMEVLDKCEGEVMAQVLQSSPALKKELTTSVKEAKPEALVLALRYWSSLKGDLKSPLLPPAAPPLPPGFFTSPTTQNQVDVSTTTTEVFSSQFLESVRDLVMDTTYSHPRLHLVWEHLLAMLLPGYVVRTHVKENSRPDAPGASARQPPNPHLLRNFWHILVDEGLLRSSHERKYLAFNIFTRVLPHIRPPHVPIVFSAPLLRCLGLALKDPKSYLHQGAKRVVDRVRNTLEHLSGDGQEGPEVKLGVALAMQRLGGVGFDQLTKTPTLRKLLDTLTSEELAAYLQQLMTAFGEAGGEDEHKEEGGTAEPSSRGSSSGGGRQWVMDQLCTAVRLPAASGDQQVMVMQFLATIAFFHIQPVKVKKIKIPVLAQVAKMNVKASHRTRQMCAARLLTLMAGRGPGGNREKSPGQKGSLGGLPEPVDVQTQMMMYIWSVMKSPVAELINSLGEEGTSILEGLREVEISMGKGVSEETKGIQSDGTDAGPRVRVVSSWVHLLRLLELHYLWDPSSLDLALVADVRRVCRDGLGVRLEDGQEDEDEEEDEEKGGAPQWADLLVDLLLSLLARGMDPLPSSPLRSACEAVFRVSCNQLTRNGLEDLMRVLMRVEQEGEEEEEREEEEEDDDDDEEEEDEEEEGVTAAQEPDGKTDMDDSDTEVGDDNEDGSASDMDDEEMLKLDVKIASYLRTLVDQRRNVKDQREARGNFQMRVLSLVEEYIKRCGTNSLVLTLTLPLLRALRLAQQPSAFRGLSQRVQAVIKTKLCKSHPVYDPQVVPPEEYQAWVSQVYSYACRYKDKVVSEAAGHVLSLLVRTAAHAQHQEVRAVAETMTAKVVESCFMKRGSRLSHQEVQDMLRRLPSLLPRYMPSLLVACIAGRSPYQKVEALRVLAGVLQQYPRDTQGLNAGGVSTPLVEIVGSNRSQLCAAVSHAVTGPFKNKEQHCQAVMAVTRVMEVLLEHSSDKSRPADVLGPDILRDIAKAARVVREVGTVAKVQGKIDRLVEVLKLRALLEQTGLDVGKLNALKKSQELMRAQQQGPKAAADGHEGKAGPGDVAAKQDQKEGQQRKRGKKEVTVIGSEIEQQPSKKVMKVKGTRKEQVAEGSPEKEAAGRRSSPAGGEKRKKRKSQ